MTSKASIYETEPKQHELKMDPDVFQAAWTNRRPWEVRVNDRDFRVGDILVCRETHFSGKEMRDGKMLQYTGRVIHSRITYIEGADHFINNADGNWVVMTVDRFYREA
jgi:hypothetical protein